MHLANYIPTFYKLILFYAILNVVEKVKGLSCYKELDWLNYGTEEKQERTKHQCFNGGEYCVKVEATSSYVYGVQRACDRELVDLVGKFYCMEEGCRPDPYGDGTICCCRSDYCNAANSISLSYHAFILILIILIFYNQ